MIVNEHDSRRLLDTIRCLKEKPEELYADSNDTERIRDSLECMSIKANIPVNLEIGGLYNTISICMRTRSAVERFFGWLKSFRRIVIRYEACSNIQGISKHSLYNDILEIWNLEMSSYNKVCKKGNLIYHYTSFFLFSFLLSITK